MEDKFSFKFGAVTCLQQQKVTTNSAVGSPHLILKKINFLYIQHRKIPVYHRFNRQIYSQHVSNAMCKKRVFNHHCTEEFYAIRNICEQIYSCRSFHLPHIPTLLLSDPSWTIASSSLFVQVLGTIDSGTARTDGPEEY